jgi:FkbM family methyltransferase
MKKFAQYARRIDRLPEILTAARTFQPFLPLTLDYLDAKALKFPMDARLQNGLRVRLMEREDVKILWHIFVRECYSVTGAESVILDLGANVGLFALYAAMRAPHAHIYCAEPVPATFRRLLDHLDWNGIRVRVTLLNCALGAKAGARFIARENVPAGQKRLLSYNDQSPGEVQVQCRTLESIFDQYHLDQVDLAKVDIEGSEYEVLLSTPPEILRRIARLDVEVHNNITAQGYSFESLVKHLNASGLVPTALETDAQGFSQASFARTHSGRPEAVTSLLRRRPTNT